MRGREMRAELRRWKRIAAKLAFLLTHDEKAAADLLAGCLGIEMSRDDAAAGLGWCRTCLSTREVGDERCPICQSTAPAQPV